MQDKKFIVSIYCTVIDNILILHIESTQSSAVQFVGSRDMCGQLENKA